MQAELDLSVVIPLADFGCILLVILFLQVLHVFFSLRQRVAVAVGVWLEFPDLTVILFEDHAVRPAGTQHILGAAAFLVGLQLFVLLDSILARRAMRVDPMVALKYE